MLSYKIVFPSGYQVSNLLDDNLDVNIVFQDGRVFFATLFTLDNIQRLMKKESAVYFWATDMIIVKDLSEGTIDEAIKKMIKDAYLEQALSEIGTIESVLGKGQTFDTI